MSLASVTAKINQTFTRLAAQGPLDMPQKSLRGALLPEEYCAVKPGSCRSDAKLDERCWQDDGCGASTQLSMRERRSLSRRYDLYGDGDLSRSSSQLGADGKWPDLYFIGDSILAQMVDYGVKCELSRAKQSIHVEYTELLKGEFGQLWKVLLAIRAKQRGIVVVSFGLHFDNEGSTNARTPKGTRAEFNTAVENVFTVLDNLRQSCPRCGALFLTATSQHFATADGAYAAPPKATENIAPSYSCRALQADALASETSPQRWREEDVLRIAARYPRVAVAPLTTLSRSWWDMHIGATSRSWRGVAYSNASRVRVDCTHFCYSLFLLEPVWWALRLVVRATAESTLPVEL